ncbi:MAG: dihydrolipoyl dehydrogenase [Thermodesulfobacteriota bacterium]|jgi:dihydrolipoamide dehydrogenase|nr:dihydrolipoyl dehydrogenase [Thermodesulfobacteriota bacterium]
MKEFDIAVIGAGPGGYVAAIRAAQQGACVCLIEKDKVGGTCLNRGCIPTKALYSTAHFWQRLKHAEDHGIRIDEPSLDYAVAAERRDNIVKRLVGGIEQLLKAHKVELFRGQALIEEPGRICIKRPEVTGRIRAKNIIIATGSRSVRPKALSIDGKNVLTSREILAIKELPASLMVVGGGYIGCEFAGIFAALGTRVTVVEQLPGLLEQSDRQVVKEVEKSFKSLGVEVHTETSVERLDAKGGGVTAYLSGDKQVEAEKVLVAVGRVPNIDNLGLEDAGVETKDGAIAVDDGLRTSAPGIYAIGDVTNIIQLAHVASYQAGIAVANAMGGDEKADYRVVPSAIFTLPEIGQVGLTEEQAKQQGIEVESGRFSYQASSKAQCEGESQGLVKIVADKKDGAILGAAIVGAEASSLVAEVAAAMRAGMSAHELGGKTIHAHPTLPEMIMEAAEDVAGLAVHKAGRRRDRR